MANGIILDFQEVSQILEEVLGMPKTRVVNWTMGKPLKIEGSFSTGSKSLYSADDVYKLGIAYELRKAGISGEDLKSILEAIQRNVTSKEFGQLSWLTIFRDKPKSENDEGVFQVSEGKKGRKETVWITVNAGSVVKKLEKKIQKTSETRKK